jgi:hypothetical protein
MNTSFRGQALADCLWLYLQYDEEGPSEQLSKVETEMLANFAEDADDWPDFWVTVKDDYRRLALEALSFVGFVCEEDTDLAAEIFRAYYNRLEEGKRRPKRKGCASTPLPQHRRCPMGKPILKWVEYGDDLLKYSEAEQRCILCAAVVLSLASAIHTAVIERQFDDAEMFLRQCLNFNADALKQALMKAKKEAAR